MASIIGQRKVHIFRFVFGHGLMKYQVNVSFELENAIYCLGLIDHVSFRNVLSDEGFDFNIW